MNRNYHRPAVVGNWATTHETHPAVAMAIHAISDTSRSAEEIWAAPTSAEWDHITMAVDEYVMHGDYPPEPDGRYPWGDEAIVLSGPDLNRD